MTRKILAGLFLAAAVSQTVTPAFAKEMYTTAGVHIRTGAGTGYAVTGSVLAGTPVDVDKTVQGWAKLEDGTYICNRYLTDDVLAAGYKWTSAHADTYLTTDNSDVQVQYADYAEADQIIQKNLIADYMTSDKDTHYYAVEAGSGYGRIVQKLSKGMIINIDGQAIAIDGEIKADYSKDDTLNVWESIGYADCIQTCTPPYGGPVVIKYGHKIS